MSTPKRARALRTTGSTSGHHGVWTVNGGNVPSGEPVLEHNWRLTVRDIQLRTIASLAIPPFALLDTCLSGPDAPGAIRRDTAAHNHRTRWKHLIIMSHLAPCLPKYSAAHWDGYGARSSGLPGFMLTADLVEV